MAKKVIRSNKAKGIKAKSQKDQKFAKLKLLSKYIVSGGNDRLLNAILDADKQTLFNMKYRTISQLAMYPHLISYINKYMNSLYDFGNITPRDWFYSIMLMSKIYGINHTNLLYFSKFQQNERDDFIKSVTAYYKEVGADPLNNRELNALFILYKFGIIQEDVLVSMKEVVSGKGKAQTATTATQQNQFNIQKEILDKAATGNEEFKLRTFDSLSAEAQTFVNNVHGYLGARNVCKQCEVNCRDAVSVDTNVQAIQPVDLMFVGFMPTKEDSYNRLPFSGGDSAKLFHRFLQPLVDRFNLKYVLTNFIFCPLDKTKQLQNKRKVVQNCSQLLDEIVKQFKPKLKIVVGLEATKIAGLKGGITKLNGKLIDDIFVLMDPDAVIINNNKLKQFQQGWLKLEEHIQNNQTQMAPTIEIDSFNIPDHQLITSITNDLTFFDSKVIKDKIVFIMLDKNGVKKYYIEPIRVPIYVKSAPYGECVNFADNVSGVVYCSEQERQLLNSKLYREINKCEGL